MTKLSVELVPSTSWYNNVRSVVSKSDWDKIRKSVYAKAGHKCEICGGVGSQWPVECHEIWEYDDTLHTQTLVGMIALCPDCHSVKHLGRTSAKGKLMQAMKHLCKVNGWTMDEANLYAEEVFEVWAKRSLHQWSVNIDVLKQFVVTIGRAKNGS